MALHGHLWTFGPFVQHIVRPRVPPPAQHFRTHVDDPARGRVRLTGRYSPGRDLAGRALPPSETALVIAVHGLGGSHRSHYMVEVAEDAHAFGMAVLRINLRGADRHGTDFYHAGLTADLRAVLASPEARAHRRVFVIGFSLGGHVTLRFAAEGASSNVAGVAAICPPIDLAAGVAEIDQPKGRLYRRNVLRALKETYTQISRRADVPYPVDDAWRIDTIREWDERIVAPRHGFASADDYYARATVAPLLDDIRVPALVVSARHDPMVFDHTVRPVLRECDTVETVFLERGGHVGFPEGVTLGWGDEGSVFAQAVRWLERHAGD